MLSPIPRKIELRTLYAVMNGIPEKQIVRYLTVSATASCGADMSLVMGFTSKSSKTVSKAEISMKIVTVFPMADAALRLLFAPTA